MLEKLLKQPDSRPAGPANWGVWESYSCCISINGVTFARLSMNDTTYAVTDMEGDFASGRAEDSLAFSQTCGSLSHMFVKKPKSVPCCRRRSGGHRVKRPVWISTAYVLWITAIRTATSSNLPIF